MPRIHGVREKRHQPFWDTLVRTTGTPAVALNPSTLLFGNANIGNRAFTNLDVAGQLASDQTYIVLALRCWLYFDGTNDRALYQQVTSQLYFTFILGDRPQFFAPCWYHPAGGGVFGFDSTTAIYNHGMPTQESIMKLGKPITIPVRQNISVQADFFAVGTTNVLTLINSPATDDQMVIMYMIDGIQTRDVM